MLFRSVSGNVPVKFEFVDFNNYTQAKFWANSNPKVAFKDFYKIASIKKDGDITIIGYYATAYCKSTLSVSYLDVAFINLLPSTTIVSGNVAVLLADALTFTVLADVKTCDPASDLINLTNKTFDVKVIKPLFVKSVSVADMTLNNYQSMTNVPVKFEFVDFNNYTQAKFWANSNPKVAFKDFY